MKLPFLKSTGRSREEIVAVDLSNRGVKAVHLRRVGDGFALANYWLQEASPHENGRFVEQLAADLRNARRALRAGCRKTVLVVGIDDAVLRNVEMPRSERGEMRQMLKLNPQHFFKQEMPDTVFDCFVPPDKGKADEAPGTPTQAPQVLVGAVGRPLLHDLERAAKRAGVTPLQITLSQTSVANAARLAMIKAIHQDPMVLLHVGTTTSAISFLTNGTLALTRVIGMGSTHLSGLLAEAYRIPDHVPEEFRPGMIKSSLEKALAPFAREARGAIDYFEDLQGKRVLAGYLTGNLAQSSLIIEMLQVLEIPCQRLKLTSFLSLDVPPDKKADVEKDLPRLDAAIGAAVGWLQPEGIDINLLAERMETSRRRWHDPIRWAGGIGACLVGSLLLWAGGLRLQAWRADARLNQARAELQSLEKPAAGATDEARKASEVGQVVSALNQHATNRFLWALPLNALQLAASDPIQVVGLKIEQTLVAVPAPKVPTNAPPKPAETREQMVLSLTAKNFADTQAEDEFIERLASVPYFAANLRKQSPVLLKNRSARQVDPLDPARSFILLTIECVYPERTLGCEYPAPRKTP